MGRRPLLYGCFFMAIWLQAEYSAATCLVEEREALLGFRNSFSVIKSSRPCGMAWSRSVDCCSWEGVGCAGGHVVSVDVNYRCLQGTFLGNNSIFKLSFLQRLDLGSNDLRQSLIPNEIEKLVELQLLDLSRTRLTGSVPLSLCRMKNLKYIRMTENSLVGGLPSCIFESPNLITLDLSRNLLNGVLPERRPNKTQLWQLNLAQNQMVGKVPTWLFTLPSIQLLDLSHNNFVGSIEPFQRPEKNVMEFIFLNNNRLSGLIPRSIFQFRKVIRLHLDNNFFTGVFEWNELEQMISLTKLRLSKNSGLTLKNSFGTVISLPSLEVFNMSYCNITEFPGFLSTVLPLRHVDISHNKIAGRISRPKSGEWGFLSFHASHNLITGFDEYPARFDVDLSFNLLKGPLKPPPATLNRLIMSNNQLSGEIPVEICTAINLVILDLSYNNFHGVLPPCLMRSSSDLVVVNLQSNHFHGSIPLTSSSLQYLILSDNKFEGVLPWSLINCSMLEVLDVGNNTITDVFPAWLEDHVNLQILILSSNNFHGEIGIPRTQNPFPTLLILDLSSNSFTGLIPFAFVGNLGYMKNLTSKFGSVGRYVGSNIEDQFSEPLPYKVSWLIKVTIKGYTVKKDRILPSMTLIDLSRNRFSGVIPATFGQLNSLKVVNLSGNILSGSIPSSLGQISELESIDLSRNLLEGQIPQGLVDLSLLDYLNLSYNKLTGPIPKGKRSGLFSITSYVGNPGLCGLPLSKVC